MLYTDRAGSVVVVVMGLRLTTSPSSTACDNTKFTLHSNNALAYYNNTRIIVIMVYAVVNNDSTCDQVCKNQPCQHTKITFLFYHNSRYSCANKTQYLPQMQNLTEFFEAYRMQIPLLELKI